jgi:type I restriction enzyme S subunit
MSGWPIVELKSIVQQDRGRSYRIVPLKKHVEGGVPIVRVSDVRGGRIATSAPLKVSPSVEASYARTRLRGGELLLTVVGTIGETAIVTRDMAGWNVARAIAVVPVQPEIGAYWVKLALCAQAPKQMMESHLNTTVQPTLNLGVVGKLPIVLPPTNLRDRIAAILGAYDDLIEVNRRRIVALEEMAQRLPVILRRGGELSGPLT